MKEVITEITLRITHITKVPDEQVDEVVKANEDLKNRQEMAAILKETLDMDNVVVSDVKSFVGDVQP